MYAFAMYGMIIVIEMHQVIVIICLYKSQMLTA